MTTQHPEALRLAEILEDDYCPDWLYERGVDEVSAELRRLHARITELEDACRTNFENYEFQRSKADRATATVYQFHYAMKDAGWHPGRTDDDLTQIIRAKGGELASATRHITELESQLAQRFDAADMATAAQAVVDRWDTPLWKDVPATAEYIGRLRAAIAAGQAVVPAGAAQADSVQEDAARYRLLRRGQHWSVIDGIGNDLRAEALDAAVDAARKQEASHDR